MTSTEVLLLPAEPGEYPPPVEADRQATLAAINGERRVQDEAAARELVQVAHWADLHRVDLAPEVAAVAVVSGEPVQVPTAVTTPDVVSALGGPLLGTEGVLQLAGEGTFAVTEFAVCEVATILGMSELSARRFVGQTIELRDRLPRCWAKVMTGVLPAWKGRQIAAETILLNAAAAGYVDVHLASFAHKMSLRRILRTVNAAVLRHDRRLAAERAAKAAEGRGVWMIETLEGTTEITAVTGTPDAAAFNHSLNRVAAALGALGDADPHQVRRAKGFGVLADPQYALDLTSTAEALPLPPAARRPVQTGRETPTIHVHLHTAAVNGIAGAAETVADVTGLGPRTLEAVQQWLRDLAPGATVKVTPVVDLNTTLSTDAYQPTAALQVQVAERDTCCAFPWCGREGRFDLDHIEPYVALDDGGPPGQTSSHNLARLCRFHHRVKTHGGWTYHRRPDSTLMWSSPHGHRYAVDRTGTVALH